MQSLFALFVRYFGLENDMPHVDFLPLAIDELNNVETELRFHNFGYFTRFQVKGGFCKFRHHFGF